MRCRCHTWCSQEALGAWQGALLGLFSILVLTPCFGFVPLEIPFEPQEFKVNPSQDMRGVEFGETAQGLFCVWSSG